MFISGEGKNMTSRIATALVFGLLGLGLAGCSSVGEVNPSQSEAQAKPAATGEAEVIREPFGGQCELFMDEVFLSTIALTGLGSANFDIDSEQAREFVLGRGYTNFAGWISDVEVVGRAFSRVDMSLLSTEEAADVEAIDRAFESSVTMTTAFASADSNWYETTYDALISIGAACD